MSAPTDKDRERAEAWLATMSPGAFCPTDVVVDANAEGRADERARIVAAMRERAGDSPSVSWVADYIESGEL